MNHYDTNSDGALVNTAPLFASSWLALFYVLRETLIERRELARADKDSSHTKDN